MTTKFISDMGPKSALIAPRPLLSTSTYYLNMPCTVQIPKEGHSHIHIQLDTHICTLFSNTSCNSNSYTNSIERVLLVLPVPFTHSFSLYYHPPLVPI